jgi:hypothetical protein
MHKLGKPSYAALLQMYTSWRSLVAAMRGKNPVSISFNALSTIALALILFSYSELLSAQQLHFAKENTSQNTEFNYSWRYQDAEYTLSFALNTAALFSMPPSPPAYSAKVFQENVYVQVLKAAKHIDPKAAKIDVKKNHSGLSFNVSSRTPNYAQKVLDELKQAHDIAQNEYWSENYFVKYHSPTGASSIRHDHAKYTKKSSEALLPIVDAIKKMQLNPLDHREFISIALGWIQSIPYNPLEDRLSSNGAGFISPRDLLLQNQGDCDSKSTLLSALLKAFDSNLDVHMVYLPEHALLAVNMRDIEGEMTINYKGSTYVLIEPTGPAQFSIGTVADSTKTHLRNRQFDLASMTN